MGSWGITAFESDAGLDAVNLIREKLPKDGKLGLENLIKELKNDSWNKPPQAKEGVSHTSPMALAEIMVKFLDGETEHMDYEEDIEDNKFCSIDSFLASKDSILWLRSYLSDTLQYAIKNEADGEEYGWKWGGWFEEKNWIGWQRHMKALISRLDELLALPGDRVELVPSKTQENSPTMGLSVEG